MQRREAVEMCVQAIEIREPFVTLVRVFKDPRLGTMLLNKVVLLVRHGYCSNLVLVVEWILCERSYTNFAPIKT